MPYQEAIYYAIAGIGVAMFVFILAVVVADATAIVRGRDE